MIYIIILWVILGVLLFIQDISLEWFKDRGNLIALWMLAGVPIIFISVVYYATINGL